MIHIFLKVSYLRFFCLLIVSCYNISNAQNELSHLKQKSYKELLENYNHNYETNPSLSKKIIQNYLAKAKHNKDTFHIAEAYYQLYNLADESIKLKYTDSILRITKYNHNTDFPAKGYFRKAQFFMFEKRNIEKAINHLAIAKKLAKNKGNEQLLIRIEYYIGIIQSEHLNEKEKALRIFKKCARFYNNKTEHKAKFRYLYIIHAIAETYIHLKKYDSTTLYNKIGYQKISQSTDPNIIRIKPYFTLCEAINKYEQNDFKTTIDSIRIALPNFLKYKDKSNILDSYYYLGKSLYDLNDKKKAIYYFKKTDSIIETLHSMPQYKYLKTYEYMKDYYKGIGDIENQNKYLSKLNTILDKYLKDRNFIHNKITKDYDIPSLLEEQKALIKELNRRNAMYSYIIVLLGFLLVSSGGIVYYLYHKKKLYKSRFNTLIDEQTLKVKTATKVNVVSEKKINVPEKHIKDITDKLDMFETQKGYLKQGLTIQSLANDMNTNIKYLSRVINHLKHKTFTSYLNELRINYTVQELQENSTLQKFTIKAIANEMGYKNSETFSNAFYKQLGIKPSYFLKNIAKAQKQETNK